MRSLIQRGDIVLLLRHRRPRMPTASRGVSTPTLRISVKAAGPLS